jgi:hypothetical protein
MSDVEARRNVRSFRDDIIGKTIPDNVVVESITNVLVGLLLAVLTQITLFPMLDLQVSVADNLLIGMIFTAISIVRSFALRRLFEAIRAPSGS